MDAIVALIVAGAVFRTAGTWQITRLACLLMVPFAIAADFLPSAVALGPVKPWVWAALAALWFSNVCVVRRVDSSS